MKMFLTRLGEGIAHGGHRRPDPGRPAHVLSFPAFPIAPGDPLPPMLGDIVLAYQTVVREAELEGKPLENHITHLIIHDSCIFWGMITRPTTRPRKWKRWSARRLQGLPSPIPTRNRDEQSTGRR